jgi:glycosidase
MKSVTNQPYLRDLPKLNFDNEGVREHILDVGAQWVGLYKLNAVDP